MRKDMAFPLSNPKTIQEDANPMRGAMDFGNQAKRLSRHEGRVKLCVLHRFPARASIFDNGSVSEYPTSRELIDSVNTTALMENNFRFRLPNSH